MQGRREAALSVVIILVAVVATLFILDKLDERDAMLASYDQAHEGLPEVHDHGSKAEWISLSPAPKPSPSPSFGWSTSTSVVAPDSLVTHFRNTKEMTAIFLHEPGEKQDVLSYDYRYGYINLRAGGSIKIDRLEGKAWFCPNAVDSYTDVTPEKWCIAKLDGVALVPWLMVPTPEAQ